MRKRYIIGFSDWFIKLIIYTLSITIFCVILVGFGIYKFNDWYEARQIRIEQELKEKIKRNIEQDKINRARYEQIIQADNRKKIAESEKAVELERIKTNTLYENTISKKNYKINRYYRNNNTMQYGMIDRFEGLRVIMKEGWYFEIDPSIGFDENIIEVGYPEYRKDMLKKLDEDSKISNIEKVKLNDIWSEEQARLGEIVQQKFPLHYSYILAPDGTYDQVKKIEGGILITKNKRRYLYTECKRVDYAEYMQSKVGKE